jgi:hypothetical protein
MKIKIGCFEDNLKDDSILALAVMSKLLSGKNFCRCESCISVNEFLTAQLSIYLIDFFQIKVDDKIDDNLINVIISDDFFKMEIQIEFKENRKNELGFLIKNVIKSNK